jgi:hypothetical protein
MSIKQRPRGMPNAVTQGSRTLGQTGGRPAQLFGSEKSAGICPTESPLEKTVGQLASLDPRVISVQPQPFTIDVVSGTFFHTREEILLHRKSRGQSQVREREYTPDFGFKLIDGKRVVVEVKDERFSCPSHYWDKVEKARKLMRSNGYIFCIISMKYQPSSALVHNADILTSLQTNFKKTITQAHSEAIDAYVGNSTSRLGDVAKVAGLTLREAPILVVRGIISADLSAGHLGLLTQVRQAYGDLQHLEVLRYEE